MKSVGIDIGSYSVKVAEVEAGSRDYSVLRLQEFPLSQDPTKDQHLEVVSILRDLAANYDPHLTRFTLGVRQEHVSLRSRFFPFRERHKILKSVAFELEDDIPFSQEDAIFEAKPTRYIGSTAEVLAVACPRIHIKRLLQTASDGTIDPAVVSIDGLAISNLFEDWIDVPAEASVKEDKTPLDDEDHNPPAPVEPDEARLVLDIGHTRTIALVYRNNILTAVRNIDWGAKNIIRAVGAKYGIQYVEALKEYRNKAYILLSKSGATKDQIEYSDCVKSVIDQLAHELKLTILEMQTEFNLHINDAAMVGGTSRLKNLGAYLTQGLEIPFNRLKQTPNAAHIDFANDEQNAVIYPVAIGLAVEGLKRPRNPAINLRKSEFAHQSEGFKLFWNKWGHTTKVAIGAFVILFTYGLLKDMFAQDLADQAHNLLRDQARNASPELKGARANMRNIRRYLREQNQILKNRELAEKVDNINSAMDILTQISSALPSGRQLQLDVKSFEIENNQASIQGQVSRPQSISVVENTLKKIALGGKLQKTQATIQASPGKQTFAYRFNVNRHKGE